MKRRVRSYHGGHARHDPRLLGRIAHTQHPCSCFMCGNPRRRGEVPIRERILDEVDVWNVDA